VALLCEPRGVGRQGGQVVLLRGGAKVLQGLQTRRRLRQQRQRPAEGVMIYDY
jgi:hypothetical protein